MLDRLWWCWRLFATALAFISFGIGGLLIPALALPFILLSSRDLATRQRHARKLVHRVFQLFIHFMRAIGILTWDLRNTRQLHEGSQLVVANHPTLLDVVFLVALTPNACCVVKSGLKSNPAMRGFIALTGYIGNDHGQQMLDGAERALAEGANLIIFPEGTRTVPGRNRVLQRGAANIAVRCASDLTPVLIDCTPTTLSKQHRWYHIPDRRFRMTITVKSKLPIADYLQMPNTLAARSLTRNLEDYFNQEVVKHGFDRDQSRPQSIDYRNA